MLILERIEPDGDEWARMDSRPRRTVFQTREWLSFVAETQGAEPVVAAVRDGSSTVGYFSGLVARRYNLRILGTPLPGWTTQYMGFDLDDDVPQRSAVEALLKFAFGPLRCMHLELRGRELGLEDVDGLGFEHTPKASIEVDLRPPEDEIWARFKGPCRTAIRKATSSGVVLEEADDIGFADEYLAQLRDVFAKQSLVPTYDVDRVATLIRLLQPTGRLLLLRARNADGECIATGIFPALNRTMYFWGGASWRRHQSVRPNEILMWHAMRYWKARGVEFFDLGGGADYKRKYGGDEVSTPFFRKSRFALVSHMREAARYAYRRRQRVLGRLEQARRS